VVNPQDSKKETSMSAISRLALSALLVIGTGTATAQPAPQPFRIGAVVTSTGVIGVYGTGIRRGVEMAINEREGKVNGREIQVTFEDDESKPQVAVQKATRMLNSNLDLLFGTSVSGATLAMMPLAAEAKVPHLVTVSADDRITGGDKSRYTFRTSPLFAQENLIVSAYMKDNFAGKKVYGVVADVGTFRDSWKAIREGVIKNGLEVIGQDFAPFGNKDWSVLIDKIAQSSADVVVFASGGADSIGFLKQAHQVGLTKKIKIIGPVLMDDTIAKAVGPAAEGVISVVRYHASIDNPLSRKFVAAYLRKYGEEPDMFAGEAYDGMSWALDVIQRTGGSDREKWVDAFAADTRTTSIKGTKKMRSCDHQAEQIGLIAVGVRNSDGTYGVKVQQAYPAAGLFPPCK